MFLTITQALAANVTAQWPGGSFFYLRSSSSPVNVAFIKNGTTRGVAVGVSAGFSFDSAETFDGVSITSETAQTVTADVAHGTIKNTSVAANVDARIVQATQANAPASVAVGTAAVAVISDAKAAQAVFKNTGTTTIYLGGASVSAASPIVLAPGDVWIDNNAAQVAWYALSSAAGGQVSAMTFD